MWRVPIDREKVLAILTAIYEEKDSDSLSELIWEIQASLLNLHLSKDALVAVRSSSTLEDLKNMAGAGLFDSILNVPLSNMSALRKAIVNVWLSLFTERAIISRKQYGISSESAHMSVLIQQQIHSDFSFIIHTRNPVNQNSNEVYIEVAVGLGETLASAN